MIKQIRYGTKHARTQRGMTLIELLIAVTVLVVGLLAIICMISTAIADNGKSRSDSTSMMLAQAVIEDVGAAYIGNSDTQLTDCKGTTFSITAVPGGAKLNGANIDFTEGAPPAKYHMDYVMCNGASQTIVDVRWNVKAVSDATDLLTVGARVKGGTSARLFAFPVNLRVYVGK
jgi:prepilin-type N-terminal cleavage/methylation domain-containing protein